jgi:hypothetical protein
VRWPPRAGLTDALNASKGNFVSRASRNPDLSELAAERSAADEKWKALLNDKSKVVQYLISGSKSTIKPHNVLIFVDLQGVYLALHKWLTDRNVPIHDGVLLGKFAHLQIERTAQEVAARVIASQPSPCFDLQQLFDSIKINYVEGNGSLANTTTAQHGMYLDISMKFELFYAPVPLKDLEWRLMGAAKRGSAEAREQLRKVKAGVVTRKGAFERDYKTYEDFVLYLKESIFHSRSKRASLDTTWVSMD